MFTCLIKKKSISIPWRKRDSFEMMSR